MVNYVTCRTYDRPVGGEEEVDLRIVDIRLLGPVVAITPGVREVAAAQTQQKRPQEAPQVPLKSFPNHCILPVHRYETSLKRM